MPADKPSEVEPIQDSKTSERYLRYALELNELIACVVDGTEIRFDARALSVDPAGGEMEIEIISAAFSAMPAEAFAALDKAGAFLRLSYSVHEVLLFARAAIRERNADRLRITVQMPLLKLQRRNALRIKPLLAHEALVQIDETEYVVHDISATGLSIVVSAKELPFFMRRKFRKGCALKFAQTEARVDLEIVSHHRSRQDGSRFKIGFQFQSLPRPMEQKIAQEAYLQTRQIWSRWL